MTQREHEGKTMTGQLESKSTRDATVRFAADVPFEEWVAHLLTVWRGFYRPAPETPA